MAVDLSTTTTTTVAAADHHKDTMTTTIMATICDQTREADPTTTVVTDRKMAVTIIREAGAAVEACAAVAEVETTSVDQALAAMANLAEATTSDEEIVTMMTMQE